MIHNSDYHLIINYHFNNHELWITYCANSRINQHLAILKILLIILKSVSSSCFWLICLYHKMVIHYITRRKDCTSFIFPFGPSPILSMKQICIHCILSSIYVLHSFWPSYFSNDFFSLNRVTFPALFSRAQI